jgi:hypothetical protein
VKFYCVFYKRKHYSLQICKYNEGGVGQRSRYSDWLRAGRSGNRNPVMARFSAPVQTGPGAHPASCTMSTGSFLGVKSGRDVMLTPHPLLVPWSRKGIAIPLLPLWAVQPVQSFSACTWVYLTFTFTMKQSGKICYIVSCCMTACTFVDKNTHHNLKYKD